MRTTIRLDEQLLAGAKRLAMTTSRTLTAVISDALREALARAAEPAPQTRFTVPTFGGDGVRPGVDLDDSAALLDLMERDADSR
ncbi:MAG: type II toxin-antitoxin system VapB family antitoxin [Actinobacteria bacterium]|nr:type II toxin-antitoxin system VapB family antitoxin [Actinomycetota bacterium]